MYRIIRLAEGVHALYDDHGNVLRRGSYNECESLKAAYVALAECRRNDESSALRRSFS